MDSAGAEKSLPGTSTSMDSTAATGSSLSQNQSTQHGSKGGKLPDYNPYTAGNPTESLLGQQKGFSRRVKRRIDYEWHEIAFLIVATIGLCVAVGFSIYRMTEEYNKTDRKSAASFTFAVLIVFNAAYLLVYAVHGIMFEHFEEMIAFALASGIVFVYVAVDYGLNHSSADGVKLARFILVMVGFPIIAGLALYCAKQFRWLKFRVAGASEEKQSMYTMFCRMESLLLFDSQIAVSLFILVMYRGSSLDAPETAILIVGLIYCPLWALFGFYAAKTERTYLVYIFCLFSVLLPAYIAYKVVKIVHRWDDYRNIEQLAIVFYIAAALGIVVRGILLIVVERVRRNFHQGLWNDVK